MSPKKRIWMMVRAILIVVLITQILFDPMSNIKRLIEYHQARIGLPYAREQWNSQGITHYKFDVTVSTAHLCIWGANIEVKNGVVIDTGKISDPSYWDFPMGSPKMSDQFPPEVIFLCDYRNYTMPALFEYLERQLQKSYLSVTRISFDKKYGFITGYGFGSSGERGLLSPRIYDCCGGFNIFNFQVLDE